MCSRGDTVGGAAACTGWGSTILISCWLGVPGMDMDEEDLIHDLDSFLCEWRRELSRGERNTPQRVLGKSTRDSGEEGAEAPARKRAALYGAASDDPPPLLVLPAAGGRARSIGTPAVPRGEEGGGRGSRTLVDTLIADLVS